MPPPPRALDCVSLLVAGEDFDVPLEATGLCRTSPDIVRRVSGMQMLESGGWDKEGRRNMKMRQ